MPTDRVFETFRENLFYWKICGIWSGNTSNKGYKYYSFIYVTLAMLVFDFFVLLNLIHTPRELDVFIREFVYCFFECTLACKVLMMITKRQTIEDLFEMINCKTFNNNDSNKVLDEYTRAYNIGVKIYFYTVNSACVLQVFLPIVRYLLADTEVQFPISSFYFLRGEHRKRYFFWWYAYQSMFMYIHVVYSLSIDTFMYGLVYLALGQFKLLGQKIRLLGVEKQNSKINTSTVAEKPNRFTNLKTCLHHYDMLLTYCELLQKLLGVTMFVQYGVATLTNCATLYTLSKHLPTETRIFTTVYLISMTVEIFLPGLLGSQLTFQNQQISTAVYNSDWIGAPESYKRSLRLLVERANKPIVLTGLQMFPLSLDTFSLIMRMSYSFYTLLRSFQE